jgi:hypothetical protein
VLQLLVLLGKRCLFGKEDALHVFFLLLKGLDVLLSFGHPLVYLVLVLMVSLFGVLEALLNFGEFILGLLVLSLETLEIFILGIHAYLYFLQVLLALVQHRCMFSFFLVEVISLLLVLSHESLDILKVTRIFNYDMWSFGLYWHWLLFGFGWLSFLFFWLLLGLLFRLNDLSFGLNHLWFDLCLGLFGNYLLWLLLDFRLFFYFGLLGSLDFFFGFGNLRNNWLLLLLDFFLHLNLWLGLLLLGLWLLFLGLGLLFLGLELLLLGLWLLLFWLRLWFNLFLLLLWLRILQG